MLFRRTFRTSLGAALLGLGLLAAAAPAEAQFRAYGGGAVAAGIVLGLMAAAQPPRPALAYGPLPYRPYPGAIPPDPYLEEGWVEPPRRVRPAPVRRIPVARPGPARPQSAVALRACRDAIAKASLPYGSTRVSVAEAGDPSGRPTDGTVTVRARIEYAEGGRREVRSAEVSCRLNGGEVVALR